MVELEGALDVDGEGDSAVLSSATATGKSPATEAITVAARKANAAVTRKFGEERGGVFM